MAKTKTPRKAELERVASVVEEPRVDGVVDDEAKRDPPPAKVPKPHAPRKPQPADIELSARQYVRARGARWERCAGFLHAMKRNHPRSATRAVWEQLWTDYWNRPVK
jgi:hypothetical protein